MKGMRGMKSGRKGKMGRMGGTGGFRGMPFPFLIMGFIFLILLLGSLFGILGSGGGGKSMMGMGMMRMGPVMWICPAFFLLGLIAAGFMAYNSMQKAEPGDSPGEEERGEAVTPASGESRCPECDRLTRPDWEICPYCGNDLAG